MRIISGKKRGYRLLSPDGIDTRPTTDRVKESLFNIIQMRFPCNLVLDLFAGSGALGIEALSRGAEFAIFAEKDRNALLAINKNLEGSGLIDNAMVFNHDCFELLKKLKENQVTIKLSDKTVPFSETDGFDVIFLDPPYNTGLLTKALDKIFEYNLLAVDGIIVTETEVLGEDVSEAKFEIIKKAKYGNTVITVMQRG